SPVRSPGEAAPIVVRAVRFGITPALRDLPARNGPLNVRPPFSLDTATEREKRIEATSPHALAGVVPSIDPVVQFTLPSAQAMPAPMLSFEGISSQDNIRIFPNGIVPPDTNGDIGPNHYVQAVNVQFQVFDRHGTPVTSARRISTLFTGIGGPCATFDHGDPIVLYDPMADRWLISQFYIAKYPDPPYAQCVAVSRTSDPTGPYNAYEFPMPNLKLNEYPHFGVWPNAYYMADNQLLGYYPESAGAFAFDRYKLLMGDRDASYIYFDLHSIDRTLYGGLPADLDGALPPPPGAPGYFAYYSANEFADKGGDALRLFEFHADFATPSNSRFIERPDSPLPVAPFDPVRRDVFRIVDQPPPGTQLDAFQGRLMHRLQYRNSGAYESLVVNHTVTVSRRTFQAGVRYYELRRPLPGGVFSVHEQATFAPDRDHRWMGSAAIDAVGNLAVGYSVSSATTFPSIRYAGRLATDPPGGLFQGEVSLIEGSGVQLNRSGSWGDYTAMSVDPVDDCTFWYTNEYYTAASSAAHPKGWVTRVGAFKFPTCTTPPTGIVRGRVTTSSDAPVANAIVVTRNGFVRTTDGSGAYSMVVPPGTHAMTAWATSLSATAPRDVIVSNGGTTTVDFVLSASSRRP
ncbi:MAG: carboxypeptidase regulatory-like domain-containing protein, partial [Acidobacteria bacterium]|nr:carboxypeptidase regulatory-like domain-containing protein [Acidobacteriota bacterium]